MSGASQRQDRHTTMASRSVNVAYQEVGSACVKLKNVSIAGPQMTTSSSIPLFLASNRLGRTRDQALIGYALRRTLTSSKTLEGLIYHEPLLPYTSFTTVVETRLTNLLAQCLPLRSSISDDTFRVKKGKVVPVLN
jgi:hypothetical protein